jgi:hypothetical protein
MITRLFILYTNKYGDKIEEETNRVRAGKRVQELVDSGIEVIDIKKTQIASILDPDLDELFN